MDPNIMDIFLDNVRQKGNLGAREKASVRSSNTTSDAEICLCYICRTARERVSIRCIFFILYVQKLPFIDKNSYQLCIIMPDTCITPTQKKQGSLNRFVLITAILEIKS